MKKQSRRESHLLLPVMESEKKEEVQEIHGSLPEKRSEVVIFIATNVSSALLSVRLHHILTNATGFDLVSPNPHTEPEEESTRLMPISQTRKLRSRDVTGHAQSLTRKGLSQDSDPGLSEPNVPALNVMLHAPPTDSRH